MAVRHKREHLARRRLVGEVLGKPRLFKHPAILEAAVVAKTDDKWGEVPCAFVTLRPDATLTADEVIGYCKEHLARFKAPKHVVFSALPKTSTGKVQKFVLREQAEALSPR